MAEINDLNITDASNTARFPEAMAPSAVNDGARALEGLVARWHENINTSIATTGSANAYVLAAKGTQVLFDGLVIGFDANFANTGAATLNVDATGVKNILKHNDVALASGDIEANQKVVVVYDGTSWQMVSQLGNAPGGVSDDSVSTAKIQDDAVTTAKILDAAVTTAKINFSDTIADATDLRLAFLLIAENAGDRLNMIDGIVDPFKDESDVDTSTSTNETYIAAGDYYDPRAAGSTEEGTDSGGNVGWTTQTITDRVWTINNSTTVTHLGIKLNTARSGTMKIVENTSGTTWDVIAEVAFSHSGGDTMEYFELSSAAVISGSGNFHVSAYMSGSITDNGMTAGNMAAYSGDASGTGLTFINYASNEAWPMGVTYQGAVANMTIVSNAFTADSAPDTGRIHIQAKAIDSITLNTDLTAEISRNGGTTFTAATLVEKETLADGTTAYEDASVDISGQSSAVAMKWRIKTLNTKDVEVHGVVLQWA